MIKEISLKNFKCFNELYLKQLKTLNIIAGKNNYGKTSILDAIFVFMM
ncbi:AAA family ATPase [Klebsiella pneumoniae]|nr:AAA family ATPase [Klebsiella pneumoniae]MDQ6121477.1 AAA family ATPase [Klebsiella pneumoniae subsp. pneumoniae]